MRHESAAAAERQAEILDLWHRYRRSAEWLDDPEAVDVG